MPQGDENPSRSIQSRWHILRVLPEPLSVAKRGRVTEESTLRKDRRVCPCCYMPVFYKGETVVCPPAPACGSPRHCVGDRGKLTAAADLHRCGCALLPGGLKTILGDSREEFGLGTSKAMGSHSPNLLPKRTEGVRRHPQLAPSPPSAFAGERAAPIRVPSQQDTGACCSMQSPFFCSLWGGMEG